MKDERESITSETTAIVETHLTWLDWLDLMERASVYGYGWCCSLNAQEEEKENGVQMGFPMAVASSCECGSTQDQEMIMAACGATCGGWWLSCQAVSMVHK